MKEGDPLAAVDKVSVMTAITQIQDSMATVRKQMQSYSEEKADTTVSATAGGQGEDHCCDTQQGKKLFHFHFLLLQF